MEPLKIALFYGDEAATTAQKALLHWLRDPQVSQRLGQEITARTIVDWPIDHSHAVDKRVEQMIDWADKAIFLFTPDPRSDYGAPHLIDEFGRWRSKKGGQTMTAIRHEDVKVHSNAAGLTDIRYKDDLLKACQEKLSLFLQEKIKPKPSANLADQYCSDLNESIQDTLLLIKQYKTKRRYADDLQDKQWAEQKIADLNDELLKYEAEAIKLGC